MNEAADYLSDFSFIHVLQFFYIDKNFNGIFQQMLFTMFWFFESSTSCPNMSIYSRSDSVEPLFQIYVPKRLFKRYFK